MKAIEALIEMQSLLKLAKTREAKRFKFWNAMDILQDARPLANERGCVLICSDELIEMQGRVFVRATAGLYDAEGGEVEAHGEAELNSMEEAKGMDSCQRTGTASSYARKYALNGLFALNDVKDSDDICADNWAKEQKRGGKSSTGLETKPRTMTPAAYQKMIKMAAEEVVPEGYGSVKEAYIAEYSPTALMLDTFDLDVYQYRCEHGLQKWEGFETADDPSKQAKGSKRFEGAQSKEKKELFEN